jgi:uncharacterized protein (DUF1778 family)
MTSAHSQETPNPESHASAESDPTKAGEALHREAQVPVSTADNPKPEQKERPPRHRRHREHTPHARQRPRQPREKKRLHRPNTRFNEEEFAMIKSAAAHCNLYVAGFLARSALAAARDLNRTSAEIADEREVITVLFDSRRKLGWASSNLNQTVKTLQPSAADSPQLLEAIAAVRRAADTVHEACTRLIERRAP